MFRKFLIIDTSSDDSFVALHLSPENLKVELLPPLKQSQTLLPAIKNLLKGEKIDFIAIGIGPGSFTGTRVGVMTAKTLSFTLSIPLVPFCSLKRFIPKANGPFTIAVDAKSHGFYTLKGVKKKESFSFEKPLLQKVMPTDKPTLNLPSLAHLLLEKFESGETAVHNEIQVSYLHTP